MHYALQLATVLILSLMFMKERKISKTTIIPWNVQQFHSLHETNAVSKKKKKGL
jgi:hypothetical protein